MTPRERVIKVLLRILAHPYRFTRRELAQHFGVSMDAVKDDINAIRVQVLLTLDVFAYNSLTEEFSLALARIEPLTYWINLDYGR